MSKQKIREFVNKLSFTEKGNMIINADRMIDLIHQYPEDRNEWISVDEYSESLTDGQLCWVLFPDNAVKLCRLNDYKQFGGIVDFWQDMGGNDRFMNATKFIKISQPLPPVEKRV